MLQFPSLQVDFSSPIESVHGSRGTPRYDLGSIKLRRLATVDGGRAFQLACLLRLSPIPSWANNYGLAVTTIREFSLTVAFETFLAATSVASLPTIASNVYLGTVVQDLTSPRPTSPAQGLLMVLGFLATAALMTTVSDVPLSNCSWSESRDHPSPVRPSCPRSDRALLCWGPL